MANEFKHDSVGTSLSQAEWEAIGTHVLDSQATGDIIYASSASQLRRLGIGSNTNVLTLAAGVPSWAAPAAAAAGSLTGSTLASGVTASSLTSVGTLTALTVSGEASMATLDIGGTNVTSTAAELNILDGVTSTAAELNLVDGSSAGSVVNSKAVIYGGSGELAGTLSTAAQGSVTSVGTLTSLTVQRGDDGIVIRANGTNGNMAGQFGSTNTDEGYMDLADGGSTTVRIAANLNSYFNAVGKAVFIGDTANTYMTTGLTINMGAADNEAVGLKSSDVTHGVTGETEADTYGTLKKTHTGDGGVQLSGYSSGTQGVNIRALQTTVSISKSTSASAAIYMNSSLRSGTGPGAVSADGNLLVMANDGTVRFIFDAEGSGFADVEWVTYATHDDLALIVDMEQELLLHEDAAKTQRRHMLEETGIIGRDSWHMENGKPRAMINTTKLAMLHHGALIQAAERIQSLESKLLALEGRK